MTFTEQLIRKKKTVKEWTLLALIWIFAFGVSVLLLWWSLAVMAQGGGSMMMLISVLAVCGLCWGAIWLSGTQTVEYEYSVFEGELSIDKIVGKRSRTRVVQVAPNKIEQLSPVAAKSGETAKFDRVLMAAPSAAEATWYVTYQS
ncbi:MAG: hypothetical protein IKI63_06075, partial [Clostridia bacterium]|nr:hypothetical protein [Clostridia bacterium]